MNYSKLLRGTLISCVVGGLTYLSTELKGGDLGSYTPFVVAGLGILINALKLAVSRR
jgi:hypothetical protein